MLNNSDNKEQELTKSPKLRPRRGRQALRRRGSAPWATGSKTKRRGPGRESDPAFKERQRAFAIHNGAFPRKRSSRGMAPPRAHASAPSENIAEAKNSWSVSRRNRPLFSKAVAAHSFVEENERWGRYILSTRLDAGIKRLFSPDDSENT